MPPTHAIRRFNRFYTALLGLLNERLLNSEFTLTEARVLYELARGVVPVTPTQIARDLVLDAGYLSRILKTFETKGLLNRTTAEHDGRQTLIALTDAGRAAFAPLDAASEREIGAMIDTLAPAEQTALTEAMATIEKLLAPHSPEPVTFRDMQAGDLGWIASRQMLLYQQEYGWDATYEPLAAEILVGFARNHDPEREKAWVAVRGDSVVGSVFCMRRSNTVAKLRLLYVEPCVRGLGLGRRLVDECIGFTRTKGYRTLTLWTQESLTSARRIYAAAGFTCVKREPHHSFGVDLVGETWDLPLQAT